MQVPILETKSTDIPGPGFIREILVSGVLLQVRRFPFSKKGPYFVRTFSSDAPGYGCNFEALLNTLLLWVRQPAAFDTSL